MGVTLRKRRRALIVVSAWCPAMIADMQRARMLAWELPTLGWDVEVLTPRASEVRQDVIEPEPAAFFAADTPVHEVSSAARGMFEALGSRTHSWRTLLPMRQRGSELLRSNRFDLVYFTTTTWIYLSLGPQWRRKFGIPFVLDFHDPWVREGTTVSPGRRSRARLAERLSAGMERAAVIGAAGVVAVSPQYIEALRKRYAALDPPWCAPRCHAVIPFGAREQDLSVAMKAKQSPIARDRREIILRYIGAGGAIMLRSFRLICRAVAALREQGSPLADCVRMELFGTTYNWKSGDPKELEAIAQAAGVSGLVCEVPERVTYRRSLQLLVESDGALILGVDDPGYMPSKLFSYALSGKPLLASLHRDSPAFTQFQANPELGHVLWFDRHGEMPLTDAARIFENFVGEAAARSTFDRRAMLEPFLSPNMVLHHAELFNACLENAIATRSISQ